MNEAESEWPVNHDSRMTKNRAGYHLPINDYSYGRFVLELLKSVMTVIFLRSYCFGVKKM